MSTLKDFKLCNYAHLEKIVIKNNSLKQLNSLIISNNENLETIEIEDGYEDSDDNDIFCPCMNVRTVIISSIIIFH